MKQLNDPKWARTVANLEAACFHSRTWNQMVQVYIKLYGDVTGTHTSGVYNPEWPDRIKNRMRDMANAVTYYSDMGYAFRPKGGHIATARKLAGFIARQDGSGYYGPQG